MGPESMNFIRRLKKEKFYFSSHSFEIMRFIDGRNQQSFNSLFFNQSLNFPDLIVPLQNH